MHVAVIGAGATGLCAARHLTSHDSGFTCVVFEQTDNIGGTWVYTEATESDIYGLPICSSMYKNLRTNLPKENMEFPGFPFVHSKSFVTANEVLKYLDTYVDHYDLKKHIKFLHHIKNVALNNKKWQICYVDLSNKLESCEEFDAVIVCNGHNSIPSMGEFLGISQFSGEVMHSHCYRTPEPFTDKTVLVCGGGPSGIDISFDLAKFAQKVYFSHKNMLPSKAFPENIKDCPVVKFVNTNTVEFQDGTCSGHIDVILICTGYKCSFPFLAPECGVTVVEDKFVYPLYKHIVNVNSTTMGFIGLPFRTFLFALFDYQVRFFLKSLNGVMNLPNKDRMLEEIEKTLAQKKQSGVPVKKYFDIGDEIRPYIEDLAKLAGLELLPPVVYDIFDTTSNLRQTNLTNYRDVIFHIIDENTFRMTGLVRE